MRRDNTKACHALIRSAKARHLRVHVWVSTPRECPGFSSFACAIGLCGHASRIGESFTWTSPSTSGDWCSQMMRELMDNSGASLARRNDPFQQQHGDVSIVTRNTIFIEFLRLVAGEPVENFAEAIWG